MPLVEDVAAPGLRVAIVKKRRPPYGFQPVPHGATVRLGRRPTDMERRLLSLADLTPTLDTHTVSLAATLEHLRRDQLLTAARPADLRDMTADILGALQAAQHQSARYGAVEVRKECARQGATFDLSESDACDLTTTAVAHHDAPHLTRWATQLAEEWLTHGHAMDARLRLAKPQATTDEWHEYASRGVLTGLKTVARAVVNRSFGSGRQYELRRARKANEFEAQVIVFTSVLDANTCLLPGTTIRTAEGGRPIETLRVGDRVLSDDGRYYPVIRCHEIETDEAVELLVGDDIVRCTPDHLFWVYRGGAWDWVEAGDICPGDLVLRDEPDEPEAQEVWIQHGPVGDAQHVEACGDGSGVLSCVALFDGGVVVPVGAVQVDEQIHGSDVHIPRVRADRELHLDGNADGCESLSEGSLQRRLTAEGHVALSGAEATRGSDRRRNSEGDSAVLAGDNGNGAIASLGTESGFGPIGTQRSGELLPAPLAVEPESVRSLTREGAGGIAPSVAGVGDELLPAVLARQGDVSTACGSVALATTVGIASLPLRGDAPEDLAALRARSVDLRLPHDPHRAGPAVARSGSTRCVAVVDEPDATTPGARHLNLGATPVLLVRRFAYGGPVYDVTLAGRHVVLVGGSVGSILSHQCSECEDADGTTFRDQYKNGEPSNQAIAMAVPYYLCQSVQSGENLCRCIWVSLGPVEANLAIDHVAQVLALSDEELFESVVRRRAALALHHDDRRLQPHGSGDKVGYTSSPSDFSKRIIGLGYDGQDLDRTIYVHNVGAITRVREVNPSPGPKKLRGAEFNPEQPRDKNGQWSGGGLSDNVKRGIDHATQWETTRPWDADKDALAGGVAGVRYNPSLTSEARNRGGVYEVGDKFFELDTDMRRQVLYHEVGHDLSDAMLADQSAWKLVDDGHMPGGAHIEPRFDSLNGQTTPGEVIAEAYALLHADPVFLHEHFPVLATTVERRAREMGFPMPSKRAAEFNPDQERDENGRKRLLRADGTVREGAEAEVRDKYPASWLFSQTTGDSFLGTAHATQMREENGHSEYAKAYWGVVPPAGPGRIDTAVNETVAEVTRFLTHPASWSESKQPEPKSRLARLDLDKDAGSDRLDLVNNWRPWNEAHRGTGRRRVAQQGERAAGRRIRTPVEEQTFHELVAIRAAARQAVTIAETVGGAGLSPAEARDRLRAVERRYHQWLRADQAARTPMVTGDPRTAQWLEEQQVAVDAGTLNPNDQPERYVGGQAALTDRRIISESLLDPPGQFPHEAAALAAYRASHPPSSPPRYVRAPDAEPTGTAAASVPASVSVPVSAPIPAADAAAAAEVAARPSRASQPHTIGWVDATSNATVALPGQARMVFENAGASRDHVRDVLGSDEAAFAFAEHTARALVNTVDADGVLVLDPSDVLTTSVTNLGRIGVQVSMRTRSGGVSVVRDFFRHDDGTLTVHHSYFSLPIEMRGRGVATEVLAAAMEDYKAFGVKSLEVYAALGNGGYTWARFGFLPSNPHEFVRRLPGLLSEAVAKTPSYVAIVAAKRSDLEGVRQAPQSDVTRAKIKELEQEIFKAERRTLTQAEAVALQRTAVGPTALWRIVDHPHGEAVMVGTGWDGDFDLSNDLQMRRFMAYVNRPIRSRRTSVPLAVAASMVYLREDYAATPVYGFVREDGTIDNEAFFDDLLGDDNYFVPTEDDYLDEFPEEDTLAEVPWGADPADGRADTSVALRDDTPDVMTDAEWDWTFALFDDALRLRPARLLLDKDAGGHGSYPRGDAPPSRGMAIRERRPRHEILAEALAQAERNELARVAPAPGAPAGAVSWPEMPRRRGLYTGRQKVVTRDGVTVTFTDTTQEHDRDIITTVLGHDTAAQEFAERVVAGLTPTLTADLHPSRTLEVVTRVDGAKVNVTVYSGGDLQIQRVFKRDENGEVSVNHSFFTLPEGMQGRGVAKAVLRESMAEYHRLGVARLETTAGLENGAYTWARFGFLPVDAREATEQMHGWIEHASRRTAGDPRGTLTPDEVAELHVAANGPVGVWRVADHPKGEAVLSGRDWHGEIRLSNASQMQRFNAYVNAPHVRRKHMGIPLEASETWSLTAELADPSTKAPWGFVRQDGSVDSASFLAELLGSDDYLSPTEEDYQRAERDVMDDAAREAPDEPVDPSALRGLVEAFPEDQMNLENNWAEWNAAHRGTGHRRVSQSGEQHAGRRIRTPQEQAVFHAFVALRAKARAERDAAAAASWTSAETSSRQPGRVAHTVERLYRQWLRTDQELRTPTEDFQLTPGFQHSMEGIQRSAEEGTITHTILRTSVEGVPTVVRPFAGDASAAYDMARRVAGVRLASETDAAYTRRVDGLADVMANAYAQTARDQEAAVRRAAPSSATAASQPAAHPRDQDVARAAASARSAAPDSYARAERELIAEGAEANAAAVARRQAYITTTAQQAAEAAAARTAADTASATVDDAADPPARRDEWTIATPGRASVRVTNSFDDSTPEAAAFARRVMGSRGAAVRLAEQMAKELVNATDVHGRPLIPPDVTLETGITGYDGPTGYVMIGIRGGGARIDRTLTERAGKRKVIHSFFVLPESMRGQGIATAVLGTSMEEYKRMGVHTVAVHASLDNGSHTWARFGFLNATGAHPTPDKLKEYVLSARSASRSRYEPALAGHERDVEVARRRVKESGAPQTPLHDAAIKMLEDAEKTLRETRAHIVSDADVTELLAAAHGRTALWRMVDHPKGSAVMSGRDWNGTIELSDELQMRRFNAYVNRPSRIRNQGRFTGISASMVWHLMRDGYAAITVCGFMRADGTLDTEGFYADLLGTGDYFIPTDDDYDDEDPEDDLIDNPVSVALDEAAERGVASLSYADLDALFLLDAASWEKWNAAHRHAVRKTRRTKTERATSQARWKKWTTKQRKAGEKFTRATAKDTERLVAVHVPPGWTNVRINADPKAKLQAQGEDAAGRFQSRYLMGYLEKNAAENFARLRAFHGELPALRHAMQRDMKNERLPIEERDAAAILYLIDKTGFRVGRDHDTRAKVQAYGASTLTARHVTIEGTTVRFSFIGKKGVKQEKVVDDADLARMLAPRVAAGGRLFAATDGDTRTYMTSRDGAHSPKDFRTHQATTIALQELAHIAPEEGDEALDAVQTRVSEIVAAHLGNQPKQSLKSYIDPAVWVRWQAGKKTVTLPHTHAAVDDAVGRAWHLDKDAGGHGSYPKGESAPHDASSAATRFEVSGSLGNDLDNASTADDVQSILDHYRARPLNVSGRPIENLFTVHSRGRYGDTLKVVEWDGADQYPSVTEAAEWVDNADPSDYYPEYEDTFNDDFWSGGGEVYHATHEENAEAIEREGIAARSESRGMSNRGTGAAVFATTDVEETEGGSYGNTVFAINVAAMARDGYKPYVSQEPDVVETELRGALAAAIGLDNYRRDEESGMSPSTVVFSGHIPAKYLRRLSADSVRRLDLRSARWGNVARRVDLDKDAGGHGSYKRGTAPHRDPDAQGTKDRGSDSKAHGPLAVIPADDLGWRARGVTRAFVSVNDVVESRNVQLGPTLAHDARVEGTPDIVMAGHRLRCPIITVGDVEAMQPVLGMGPDGIEVTPPDDPRHMMPGIASLHAVRDVQEVMVVQTTVRLISDQLERAGFGRADNDLVVKGTGGPMGADNALGVWSEWTAAIGLSDDTWNQIARGMILRPQDASAMSVAISTLVHETLHSKSGLKPDEYPAAPELEEGVVEALAHTMATKLTGQEPDSYTYDAFVRNIQAVAPLARDQARLLAMSLADRKHTINQMAFEATQSIVDEALEAARSEIPRMHEDDARTRRAQLAHVEAVRAGQSQLIQRGEDMDTGRPSMDTAGLHRMIRAPELLRPRWKEGIDQPVKRGVRLPYADQAMQWLRDYVATTAYQTL